MEGLRVKDVGETHTHTLHIKLPTCLKLQRSPTGQNADLADVNVTYVRMCV